MSRLQLRRVAAPSLALALSGGLAIAGLTAVSAGTAGAAGTPGVTATSVTIGATVPLTGIASLGYNQVAKAANAVFKYVNSKGGVNGRKINFLIKDDCYNTPGFGCTTSAVFPYTTTQTQALISTPVFATVGSLGTPTQDSVRALLKQNGVPQTFVNSGAEEWQNGRATYPMLFGWQPSYVVESKILAKYIESKYKGQKVCFLGQNDDFGKSGQKGLADEKLKLAITQYYDVTQLVIHGGSYFTPFIQAEQKAKCTVVYYDTIPGATDAALGNAKALGYHPHFVISSVGADPWTIHQVLGSNDNEPGAISFSYLPVQTDTNSWNAWEHKVLAKDPADFPGFTTSTVMNGNQAYGIGWGVAFVEALRAEGKNLTRAGFVHILQSTTYQTPALLPLKYSSSNHQGLLGGYVVQVLDTSRLEPVPGGGKTVYTSDNNTSTKVSVAKRLSQGIPSWLK